jgi:hypothetical protein
VLEKVCEYFYYNEKHKNSKDVPDIDVPAELCLELLMAADYLNGESLHPSLVSSYGRCLPRNKTCSRFAGISIDESGADHMPSSLIEERTQSP